MKKVTIFFLTFAMILSLMGCGDATESSARPNNTSETEDKANAPLNKPVEERPQKKETEVLPVEIKEFGYSMDGSYLYYSIHLYNPNKDYTINYPSFRVTARDKSGVLLGTEEHSLMEIYPEQDSWSAHMAFRVEEEPETVDVEMIPPADYHIEKASTATHKEFKPLEVINTAVRDGGFRPKLVGEVKNENDYAIETAIVTIVFRDEAGVLLGGDSCFVDNVPAGGTAPFENSLHTNLATDSYEIYAGNWS